MSTIITADVTDIPQMLKATPTSAAPNDIRDFMQPRDLTDDDKYDRLLPETVPPFDPTIKIVFVPPEDGTNDKPTIVPFELRNVVLGEVVRKAKGCEPQIGYRVSPTRVVPLEFQGPEMEAIFGWGLYDSIDLGLSSKKRAPRIENVRRVLRCLDLFILQAMASKRREWLPGLTYNVAENRDLWKHYSALTRARITKGRRYPPHLSVKVWHGESLLFAEVTPEMKGQVEAPIEYNATTVPAHTWLRPIFRIRLWSDNVSKVSPSAVMRQARIVANPYENAEDAVAQPYAKPSSATAMFVDE
jgi:hypothetical protein